MTKVFTKGELTKFIMESSTEFKPKLGDGVESGNKSNNDKAYKETKKRVKDFDGGGDEAYPKGKAKFNKVDDNETTLGYEVENASPEYKKRVNAQMKGYTSELEMNNGIEKAADFGDNDNIRKEIEKSETEVHDKKRQLKKTGLAAREMPDSTFKKDELYEAKYPTAWFKKTTFLTENHMFSKIPDEFKKEGNIFNMKDKTENTYLCEWKEGKAIIVKHNNKNGLNESINRMKELWGYKPTDSKTSVSGRLNENEDKFNETLDKMRRIIY